MAARRIRLIDIGANLTDPVFRGIYRGKHVHPDDFGQVLERARAAGVERVIVTGGSLSESEEALALAEQHDGLYSTVGVHPTRCSEFDAHPAGPADYLRRLLDLARRGRAKGKVVAVGELGLDFDPDRAKFCPPEVQEKYFELQLSLSDELGLPLFLHCRSATDAFVRILSRNRAKWKRGVAHSFTAPPAEALAVLALEGMCIGFNGCSLKTPENLDTVRAVPLDRVMLESDAPWCDIRRTHASWPFVADEVAKADAKKKEKWEAGRMVKERNEPAATRWVAAAVAGSRGEKLEEVCARAWDNAVGMFFPGEDMGGDAAPSAQP
ncbi:putative deoxyribonuclease TATDN1-like protein [Hyaloraphidium curvatum]|nr:putative deoxyribonuclease TATDN1-like protein [Hyaloraphidium curvatum]